MARVILSETAKKDKHSKVVSTLRISVDTDKLWNGWTSPDGTIIEGLKAKTSKPERIQRLKEMGYSPSDEKKIREAGLDI